MRLVGVIARGFGGIDAQGIALAGMSGFGLRTHAQRVGSGSRLHRSERRMMRVVAFDAAAFGLGTQALIPIAIDAAMRSVLPIAVNRAMALGAQELRLIPGNRLTEIVDKGVTVGGMMAVEAAGIDPVIQLDFGMLGEAAQRLAGRRNNTVTIAAAVIEAGGLVGGLEFGMTDGGWVDGPSRGSLRGWGERTSGQGIQGQDDGGGDERQRNPA